MTTTNEIKRVSDIEWSKAYQQMLDDFEAQTGMEPNCRIQFYFDHPDRLWDEPQTMQVNWSAIGTVMPEEAAKFGKALMVAAKLAENFIYNGYKVYYED